MIQLSNDHISIAALCVVWSTTDRQLVAAQVTSGDRVSLNAIKAELEKSSGHSGLSLGGDASGWVDGAKHGFVNLMTTLEKVNAHGNVLTMLHRNAHDPRMILTTKVKADDDRVTDDRPHFYVVCRQGDDLKALFIERLQLAMPWPIKEEWADILLTMGRDNNLIESLNVVVAAELELQAADQPELKGVAFVKGLRIVTDSDAWSILISSAIQQNFIQI